MTSTRCIPYATGSPCFPKNGYWWWAGWMKSKPPTIPGYRSTSRARAGGQRKRPAHNLLSKLRRSVDGAPGASRYDWAVHGDSRERRLAIRLVVEQSAGRGTALLPGGFQRSRKRPVERKRGTIQRHKDR